MKPAVPPDIPERQANEQALIKKLTKEQRMKIDGTLNINTLITAGSLLVSGALAYATLDKRISLLEQQTAIAVQTATERAGETKDALRDVKNELKEIRSAVSKERK